jgi:reactive intermediate/imine deaminase
VSNRAIISTSEAPSAIGPYSQAVKVGNTVWISGQIPLDPQTMTVVEGDVAAQATRAFRNLAAIAEAAGGSLDDAVKINISLIDMNDFAAVNGVMEDRSATRPTRPAPASRSPACPRAYQWRSRPSSRSE